MTILKPAVPGTVIRFVGDQAPSIPPSAASTVAIPLIHDSGPLGADAPGASGRLGGVQILESFAEWTAMYGDSDTPGRTAVAGAFAGQGMPGAPGAGAVAVYRMGATGVLRATVTIQTSGGSPVSALTLTAIYAGVRGNKFSYILDSDPSNVLNDRLRLLYNGAVQETYTYAQTDVIGLAAQINSVSQMVSATDVEVSAARLAASAGTPLTGGNDGAGVLAADHLAALAALALYQFGIIAPYDLTSAPILASYVSWIDAMDTQCRPVRLVCGGAAGETLATAITRSAACNDWHVVNVGVGTYHDDLLGKDLSTSQLAPRIAGILAACGEVHALTYRKIAGLHPVGGTAPTSDLLAPAIKGGVVVLQFANATDADLRICKGVTTWTTTTDTVHPLSIYSDARLVGVMDDYTRNMKQWGDDIVIGALPVNDDTRNLVRGQARKMQDDLLRQGLILPGDNVTIPKPWVICEDPGDPTLLDAIPYTFGWQFAQTANAILGEGHVR